MRPKSRAFKLQRDKRTQLPCYSLKKRLVIPANPQVLKLAKKMNKDLANGMSKIEIARDFCEGDEKKAKSLLRQLRRYPDLLS